MATPRPPAAGPLAGVRIVECGRNIAAPYAAMLLAEQGAEVIKLITPGLDPARALPGWHVWNRSKSLLRVDPSTAADAAVPAQLCAAADVLITDAYPIGGDIDADAMLAANPRLIHCWMPPYGAHGPSAAAAPNDDLVAARSGLLASQWARRDGPVFLTIPIASYGTAMLAAGAVCAALCARQRTGAGQRVEVSWLAGALAMQTGGIIHHPALQRVMQLIRDPQGPIPVYRLFKASDDWLFIACGNPTFWNKLCLLLDRPEMVSDPRFDGAPWAISPAHWAELKATVQSAVGARPREHWLGLLREADIPCAPVLTRFDFIDDAQVRHLGMRQEIAVPELGRTVQMGVPVSCADERGAVRGSGVWIDAAAIEFSERPQLAQSADAQAAAGCAPLAGVRVLDFTSYIAGPAAAMTLALAGADVIKVEGPRGDPFRAFGFGFFGWNQGKRGLAIDFAKPEAGEVIADLVRTADVLVENLRPGGAERLGIDYPRVAALNPRLIYGSITGFGASGPRGRDPGFDPLLQARSGLMAAQGGHGGDPVFLACAVSDYSAGLLCAFGVMAALFARRQSGRGQHVETSLAQAAMAVQSGEFVFYDGRPDMENGGGDLVGRHPWRRAYLCRDGWLFISASAAQAGRAPAWMQPGAAIAPAPVDGEVAERIAASLAERSRGEVLDELAGAEIAAAPVLDVAELFSDPQILANHLTHTAEVPQWGAFQQTGALVHYAATPVTIERPAPQLGEHGADILRTVLGYSAQRIEQLRSQAVVSWP